MKKIIVLAVFITAAAIANAQHPSVKAFYDKYMGLEKVTNISLQGWVLQMAAEFTDEEDGKALLEKITKLRVMVMEEGNLVSKNDYRSLTQSLEKDSFEKLMDVRDGDDNIDIYLQEKGGNISNVLLMVNSPDEFVMLSLEGNLKFEDLKKLDFDLDGAEHFKKIPKDKKDVPRA